MKIDWMSFGIGAGVGIAAGAVGMYAFLQNYTAEEEGVESYAVGYSEGYSEGQGQARKILRERAELERIASGYSTESEDVEEAVEPEIETVELEEPVEEEEVDKVEEDFIAYMEEEIGVNPREGEFKEPYVISYSEFENENPEYDKIHLTYYPAYGILATDEEEVVDGPGRMIGNVVISFIDEAAAHGGFDMKNNPLVHVRNDGWGADYEVELSTKLQASGWIRDYMEGLDA